MDSIGGLNHFSYMPLQHNIAAAPVPAQQSNAAVVSDGFAHGVVDSDSVMSQTDALKFLSSAEHTDKTAAVTADNETKQINGVQLSLNGIGTGTFFYLEI